MILGVLGGSFDPVHRGHQALVAEVLAAKLADGIVVVPAWLSPHKDQTGASAAHRLAMVELAFAEVPLVEIDAREIAAGKVCFTADTLADLQRDFPGVKLRLIVGADNLAGLPSWRSPERVLDLAEIIVVNRDGSGSGSEALGKVGLPADRFLFLDDFQHPVSSTVVRRYLAAGEVSEDLLPYPVVRYIKVQGLYRSR